MHPRPSDCQGALRRSLAESRGMASRITRAESGGSPRVSRPATQPRWFLQNLRPVGRGSLKQVWPPRKGQTKNGRTGGIRTHDLYHPKVARYQTAPHPVKLIIANCRQTINTVARSEDFSADVRREEVVGRQFPRRPTEPLAAAYKIYAAYIGMLNNPTGAEGSPPQGLKNF